MLKKIKEFFTGKPASERHPLDAVTTPNVTAPYKVPEPEMTPIPYVPLAAPVVVDDAPVVVEAPAKKPRKPRTPKAAPAAKAPAKARAPRAASKSKKV